MEGPPAEDSEPEVVVSMAGRPAVVPS
jgi:hypothetical protein